MHSRSFRSWSDNFEETLIALLLGAMTIITFANVIARANNSNILWALEATVYLFAWLVLLGASYGVKHNFHIGVDIVVRLLPTKARRFVTLIALVACLVFCLLLLKGSWDYWWAFANKRAFLEVNDIPMPDFLQFLADWLNDGEQYEKIPRFIPYFVLPLSMSLLTLRFVQAGLRIYRGEQELLVESHEAESLVADQAAENEYSNENGDAR